METRLPVGWQKELRCGGPEDYKNWVRQHPKESFCVVSSCCRVLRWQKYGKKPRALICGAKEKKKSVLANY